MPLFHPVHLDNRESPRDTIAQDVFNSRTHIIPKHITFFALPEDMIVVSFHVSTHSPTHLLRTKLFTLNFRCNKESSQVLPTELFPYPWITGDLLCFTHVLPLFFRGYSFVFFPPFSLMYKVEFSLLYIKLWYDTEITLNVLTLYTLLKKIKGTLK